MDIIRCFAGMLCSALLWGQISADPGVPAAKLDLENKGARVRRDKETKAVTEVWIWGNVKVQPIDFVELFLVVLRPQW